MCSGVLFVFLLTSIVKQVKWRTKLADKTLKGCSTRGCAWLVLCFQFPAGCQTIYFWFNLHFYLTFAQKQTNTLRISSDRQDRVGRHEGRRKREKGGRRGWRHRNLAGAHMLRKLFHLCLMMSCEMMRPGGLQEIWNGPIAESFWCYLLVSVM